MVDSRRFRLTILGPTAPAWAWGRIGHRVIARLAENQLSPKAKAAIAGLLGRASRSQTLQSGPMSIGANCRNPRHWHYVDVPLDEPRYHSVFAGDVPERGYVVDKIHDFKVVAKDSSRSLEDRRVALRFLVHFVEDLHMPMHVGDNNDKGGNRTQVRFFDRGTNMHSLWDSGMIEFICDTEDFWMQDLACSSPHPRVRRRPQARSRNGRPKACWRPGKRIWSRRRGNASNLARSCLMPT